VHRIEGNAAHFRESACRIHGRKSLSFCIFFNIAVEIFLMRCLLVPDFAAVWGCKTNFTVIL